MKSFLSHSRYLLWSILTLGFLASCSNDRDKILGPDSIAALPPTVTAFTPANNATGVFLIAPGITVTFSEPMAPITGDARFTVTCQAPCTNPDGTVSLDGSSNVATYTLNAGSELEEDTVYTATVTGAESLATGLTLEQATVWTFTTVTRPIIIAVAPANNAIDVPVNSTVITAEFSEPVASLTGDASFTVTCEAPCSSPTGTVTLDTSNEVATYTLATGTQLEGNTLYTATVTDAQSLATGLTMAAPFVWSFTTGMTPDTTHPRVTTTIPITTDPGPTPEVSVTSSISATFTEDMAPISITNPGTFTLSCEAPCVSPNGVVSYSVGSRTATFSLSPVGAKFESGTTYTATITTVATDLADNALAGNQEPLPAASDYVWTFTTVARLTVIAVAPLNNAIDVPVNSTVITAEFSEPVASLAADGFTVTCEAPCTSPTGTVTLDSSNEVATYTLAAGTQLEGNTLYSATVTDAQSLATGLTMAEPFVWSFTTGLTPDTTRPRVTTTIPFTTEPGPTPDVSVTSSISATFTEDMAPISITNAGTFTLSCESPCVSPNGVVSYSVATRTTTFNLTPAGTELQSNATYTATITTVATDLAGNALAGNQEPLPTASNYVWSFTTPTSARPTVTAITPTNNAAGVSPVDPGITATFNEPMAPITGSASFTVTCEAPCINPSGAVSLDASNTVATYSLSTGSELEGDTTYTATVDGAESLETGLTLAEATVWTFTTAARPLVTATTPANNATGVSPVDPGITATFSEPMAPITGSASFTVTCEAPCVNPTGTVSLDASNTVATFSLASGTELEGNTTYTAIVDGAESLATGLTLEEATVWSFTTAVPAVIPPPEVTATTPANNAVGVSPVDPDITVTFSEPMAPLSGDASFTVTCEAPCSNPTGTVTLNATSEEATFTQTAGTELDGNTTYTASVSGAQSLATGLSLEGATVWTFTTAARPTVTAITPANNATGVSPVDPGVTASFSEPMAPITGSASFTVTCESPCSNPNGTVSLNASNTVATYNLTAGTELEGDTTYTATIDGAESLETALALAEATVWTFTTASRPTVIAFTPANNATLVSPVDPNITVTFSEPMAALVAGNFTVTCEAPCTNPSGTVSLDATNEVAAYALDVGTELEENTTYTATVDGAASLATGLTLEEATVWTFTTAARPRVTAVAPVNNATGVPVNTTEITADFTEPMTPLTGDASFVVTCEAPCISPTGTVTLDATNEVASFTLDAALEESTVYTATITAGESLETGLTMANPFVWSFTTGLTPDTTRPRVTITAPETSDPGPTIDVPINTSITAAFTEDMAPITITDPGTFTLTCEAPCVSPDGAVSYSVGSRTATFSLTPAGTELEPGTTYTATIAMAATDLAGNALAGNQAALPAASDYIWSFTTAFAAIPPADITVTSVTPPHGDVGVCPNATINATFDVSSGFQMDPDTINALTFTVFETNTPLNTVTAGSIVLDGPNDIATFTPQIDLVDGIEYTATVKGGENGVKDLAVPANIMVQDFVWNFHVGPATGDCLQSVDLKTAVPFGMLAGTAGMTNQGTLTTVNGDLGTTATATSAITGFRDANGDVYTVTGANDGIVNGIIFSCTNSTTGPTSGAVNPTNCNAATIARNDAIDAFNELAGLPAGPDPAFGSPKGNLANEILAPGVYTSESGSFLIDGGDLTLDAQGDANAVWVFQMTTSLTVGGPGATFPQSVILINGAQAKNVFWQVGSSAIINAAGGGTMVGTIIASTGVAFSTAGNVDIITLDGRAMSLNASVTLVNTIINVPAQ